MFLKENLSPPMISKSIIKNMVFCSIFIKCFIFIPMNRVNLSLFDDFDSKTCFVEYFLHPSMHFLWVSKPTFVEKYVGHCLWSPNTPLFQKFFFLLVIFYRSVYVFHDLPDKWRFFSCIDKCIIKFFVVFRWNHNFWAEFESFDWNNIKIWIESSEFI